MGNAQMFADYLHPIALGQGERALSRSGLRFRAFPASKVALSCNRPELWRHDKNKRGASAPRAIADCWQRLREGREVSCFGAIIRDVFLVAAAFEATPRRGAMMVARPLRRFVSPCDPEGSRTKDRRGQGLTALAQTKKRGLDFADRAWARVVLVGLHPVCGA